ncbi:MAG: serine/threonine-protein phosphatase, partial [Oscillospiraceae bacterium]
MSLRITASTDAGCRHDENEDYYRAGRLSDDTYWIVLCDGMGGVAGGGLASSMAAQFLQREIQRELTDITTADDVKTFLLEA